MLTRMIILVALPAATIAGLGSPRLRGRGLDVTPAGDEAVYVGDRLACRVVRLKLDYRVERTVPMP